MAKFVKEVAGYQILETIGNPQESRVSVAREMDTDRRVAIKALPLDFFQSVKEFEQFAELTARVATLKHPNLLVPQKVIGKYTEAYLIGDLIDGPNIRTYIAEKAPDVPAVVPLALQLITGLQFLHSKKLLHRNIKGTNVLLDRTGARVWMCDMYYSSLFVRWRRERGFPSVEAVRYVSPEECQEKKLVPESDVYSLGIVLFYAFTRTMPIRGQSVLELQTKHIKMSLRERPEVINPRVPKYISEMLIRMLAKSPKKRYSELGELILDLRRMVSDKPGRGPALRI